MLKVSDLKINNKYFITFNTPYFETLYLRVIINKIEPKVRENLVDYITFRTLPSSKDFIDECRLNAVLVPIPYIIQKETLKDIFNNLLIDDIIYLIDEFI
jgi:hypothetical protein